jgi:hypothetical protein
MLFSLFDYKKFLKMVKPIRKDVKNSIKSDEKQKSKGCFLAKI